MHWLSVEDLPKKRGFYTAIITTEQQGTTETVNAGFCRVDRPGDNAVFPLTMDGTGLEGKALLALASTGIQTLRIDPEFDERSLQNHAMELVLRLNGDTHTLPQWLAENPALKRYEIEADLGLPVIERLAKLARTAHPETPITLILAAIDDLAVLMEKGVGQWVDSVQIPAAQAGDSAFAQIRHITQEAGYEQFPVYLDAITTSEDTGGNAWQRTILSLMPHQLSGISITAQTVLDDDVKAALADVNGLAHRFFATTSVGPKAITQGAQAHLYRNGASWLLAFWSEEGTKSAYFDLSDTEDLRYTDAWNNVLPLPEAEEGQTKFEAKPGPRYLSGQGGSLPAQAASAHIQTEAQALLKEENLVPGISESLKSILQGFSGSKLVLERGQYLALLRELPVLETAWHSGTIPRKVAVPAIARVADIARGWATLEQARGEVFLEPLPDTLSRCKDLQQLYLTGTQPDTTLKAQRGAWLVKEISRLSDEALTLSHAGLRIEAAAIAALAEWRAKSLRVLTNTKLSIPEVVTATIDESTSAPVPVPGSTESMAEEAETPLPEPDAAALPEPVDPMQLLLAPVPFTHKVVPGESPGTIAQKYGVSTADLLDWNNIRSVRSLQIGQVLTLYLKPDKPPADDQPAGTLKLIHTVQRGDTPAKISARYKVDQKDFEKVNGLLHNAQLSIGKKYTVYLPLADMALKEVADIQTDQAQPPGTRDPGQPTGTNKVVYEVKRGDNPYVIARRNGVSTDDVLKWNKLTKRSILNIGDKIVLYIPR